MPGEDTVVGINPSTQQGQSSSAQQGDNFVLDFGDGEALENVVSTTNNKDSNIETMVNNDAEDNTFNDFDISMGEEESEEDKVVEEVEPVVEEVKEEQEPEVEIDLSDTVEEAKEESEEDKVVEEVEPVVEEVKEQEPEVEINGSDTVEGVKEGLEEDKVVEEVEPVIEEVKEQEPEVEIDLSDTVEEAKEESEEDKVVEEVEPVVEEVKEQEPEVEIDLSDTVEEAKEESEEDKVVEEVKEEQEPLVEDKIGAFEDENFNNNTLSNLNVVSDVKVEDNNQFSKDKLMDEIALLDDSVSGSSQSSKILEQLKEEGDMSSKSEEKNIEIEDGGLASNNIEDKLSDVDLNTEENSSIKEKDVSISDNNSDKVDGPVVDESFNENVELNNNVENNNVENNSVENSDQEFTLDYTPESQDKGVAIDESISENTLESNVQEIGQGISNKAQDNPSETVMQSEESTQDVEVQSTLSLDQILDSELLSGQQFVDNSVAVPINKPESNGNRKLVMALAGVGLFLLVGFVAVLAFPGGNQGREEYEIVSESGNVLEPDHGSSEITRPEETNNNENQSNTGMESNDFDMTASNYEMEEYSSENNLLEDEYHHNNSTTSSVTFPDVGGDDQSDYIDTSIMDATVYTGFTENWTEEVNEDSTPSISVKEVTDLISSFKSQAEVYYTYGQENQDRYLIKYAAKITYLCDIYDQELKELENVDTERLEGFKAEVNGLISKIESHNNGGEEKPILVQSANEENSNFEGKDEIKDYLYSK